MKLDASLQSYVQPGDCSHCQEGKQSREPFGRSNTLIKATLGLVHSDLAEDFKPPSKKGFKYVMTFLDKVSQFSWLYLLKEKSGAIKAFKLFVAEVERESDRKLK